MASYAFRISGIEPAHDPAWKTAPESMRRAYWQAVVKLGLSAGILHAGEGAAIIFAALVSLGVCATGTAIAKRKLAAAEPPPLPDAAGAHGVAR